MKNNRIISVLLLAAIIFSLAYGCSNDNNSSPSANPSTPGTVSSAEPSAAPAEEDNGITNPAGVFPIAKEMIEITFAVPSIPQVEDYETNYFTKYLEEKAGVSLVFQSTPSKEMGQKVQLALASGIDLPDAFVGVARSGSPIFNTTNIIRYAADGLVIPLNNYIDKYGENIKALFNKYSDGVSLRQLMTSADGNIYFMPGYGPSVINRSTNKMWINKSWLDNLGLSAPTTTDEFRSVLEAFLANDPNKNGKADDIPFIGTVESATYDAYDYLIGAFTINNAQFHRLTSENGKVTFAATTDAWREAMKYINDLTKAGLLSPLTFTQDLNSLKQIVNDDNNICGGFTALGRDLVAQKNNPEICQRYEAILPLKGPNGFQSSIVGIPLPSAEGVITSACEYPEVVFRIFDLMIGEEASTLNRYGIEGENWVKPDAGALSNYGDPATLKVTNNIWMTTQNTSWMNYSPFVNDIHNNGQQASDDPKDSNVINATAAKQYSKFEPTNTIPTLIYNLDEVEVVTEYITNIDDYIKTTIAKFAVGELDPYKDADWNRYLGEYKVLGLDEFLEISQAAFDRMEDAK